MQNASITFCKANPTIDDGREFAHYLDEAAEGFFHFMLGRQFVEIIANAFIQQGHDLSHQNATFARRNKIIVGMVSGYTAEQHRQSSDRPLKQAAGRFNLRMIAVSTLFSPSSSVRRARASSVWLPVSPRICTRNARPLGDRSTTRACC